MPKLLALHGISAGQAASADQVQLAAAVVTVCLKVCGALQSWDARLDCRHPAGLGGHLLGINLYLLNQAQLLEAIIRKGKFSTAFSPLTVVIMLGFATELPGSCFSCHCIIRSILI